MEETRGGVSVGVERDGCVGLCIEGGGRGGGEVFWWLLANLGNG